MTLVYTAGTFDLLHIGHVRIIRSARRFGDRLVVAVSTDELGERLSRELAMHPGADTTIGRAVISRRIPVLPPAIALILG